jgi:putative tricarboxylic transport membrane protein
MSASVLGFADALRPDVVAFVFLGVLLGYVVGVLPGLNRPAALAIAVPLSYYMSPLSAVAFLIGIAKASGAGGATTAILINTPGEPNAAATALDGYPLAKAGKGEKALKVALYASVAGDILATTVLIVVAEPLAKLALKIGPVELAALTLLALTFIAALSGKSLARGLVAAFLGILFAMVGTDAETATPRLTFGFIELADGVPIMAITVGMLAFTEMLIQGQEHLARTREQTDEPAGVAPTDSALTLAEIKSVTPTTLMSSAVGIVVGIIPGLGPTVASFLAYALAKRMAKPHERFGEGELKGVAAAETADNAVVPASLIPLFALGLPGSVSAAIIIAAFTVHGVTPGPRMFEEHGRLMYGIYGSMIVASLLMLVVGRVGLSLFAKLTRVPATVIIPTVLALCILGAYMETKSVFSVWLMFGFGVLGWVMHRFDYSRITFLIGFVVGPLFELAVRQSIIITHADPVRMLQHPVALALVACALAVAMTFTLAPRRESPAR